MVTTDIIALIVVYLVILFVFLDITLTSAKYIFICVMRGVYWFDHKMSDFYTRGEKPPKNQ